MFVSYLATKRSSTLVNPSPKILNNLKYRFHHPQYLLVVSSQLREITVLSNSFSLVLSEVYLELIQLKHRNCWDLRAMNNQSGWFKKLKHLFIIPRIGWMVITTVKLKEYSMKDLILLFHFHHHSIEILWKTRLSFGFEFYIKLKEDHPLTMLVSLSNLSPTELGLDQL
jgi:hypothetical protein